MHAVYVAVVVLSVVSMAAGLGLARADYVPSTPGFASRVATLVGSLWVFGYAGLIVGGYLLSR